MAVEIAEADEVAGEGEFENVLGAVGAALEETERATLDPVDVAAGVTLTEQRFAGVQRAHVAIRNGGGGLFGPPGNDAFGLDECKHWCTGVRVRRTLRICGYIATIKGF